MKTIITIEHNDRNDLSTLLGKVSNDISNGYVESSGVLTVNSLYNAAPVPAMPSDKLSPYYNEPTYNNPESLSTYEFATETD